MKKAIAILSMGLLLAACDPQRIERLEEGVSTEADVRAQFGEPAAVWDAPGGGRTLEYNRQPAGHSNYMITIGPDGKMSALRQVLHPRYFEQIKAGMPMEQVRRTLGRPARVAPYPLKHGVDWEYRWLDGTRKMVFTVTFDDRDWRVVRTHTVEDFQRDAP